MNRYTFTSQEGKAYYYNSIPDFIKDESRSIIGELVNHSFADVTTEQRDAWLYQIDGLKTKLKKHKITGNIIFEYDIIRLGKRIDVILLIKDMVFSLEFKNGKRIFEAQDARQAEDYAIDIKNFHKESEDLYVCPILVATHAEDYHKEQLIGCYSDKQVYLQRENMKTLPYKIEEVVDKYATEEQIDFEKWFNSPYHPTPTIISAAVEAYKTHNVSSIANSEAGQENIEKCEEAIRRIIKNTREKNKKSVCFVTGVPGAGKTLVGLDIVSKGLDEERLSVYLSGNGPLVRVLREALRRSVKEQLKDADKETKKNINSAIFALIQSGYQFKLDAMNTENAPPEHIMIFDEAQRVWSKAKMISKHEGEPNMHVSEPELLYSVMDRRDDWAVMVCLVGLGQDIHDGEVGITEWFKCGIENYDNWDLYYSPEIMEQIDSDEYDINLIEKCDRCHPTDNLHLKTSVRSFRADRQSLFVDYLLDNQPEKAKEVYQSIKEQYPMFVTREVEMAKKWAMNQVRGTQRCGMLASSGAKRLRGEGVYLPKDMDVENWFLAPTEDVRSSNMMEVVASEFDIQGLEIDWSVVC